MDIFWQAPPISRTIVASAVVMSALVYGRILSGYSILFSLPKIFSFPPEPWRLVTSFLLTGSGMQILFDSYFFYTYASQLETKVTRFTQPGNFVFYLMFVCSFIALVNGVLLSAVAFFQPLLLAVTYTYAQEFRDTEVRLMGIVPIRSRYLPLTMLACEFFMAGPNAAMFQATGILAAHAYEYLTVAWPSASGRSPVISTPAFVHDYTNRVLGLDRGAGLARGHGTAYFARS